jgi:predicted enzyme related to lactoylglutathione lyase
VNTGSKEGIYGGLWPISPSEGHSMVQLFVRVDDVKAYVEKAEKLGGRLVIPAQKLPGSDEMAVVVDPAGIPFAVFRGSGSLPL